MNKIGIKALQEYTVKHKRLLTICMSDDELVSVIAQLDSTENPRGYKPEDVVSYINVRFGEVDSADSVESMDDLEEFMKVIALRAPYLGAEWKIDHEYKSEQSEPLEALCVGGKIVTLEI